MQYWGRLPFCVFRNELYVIKDLPLYFGWTKSYIGFMAMVATAPALFLLSKLVLNLIFSLEPSRVVKIMKTIFRLKRESPNSRHPRRFLQGFVLSSDVARFMYLTVCA
jgi:hypothetical protein